MEVPAEVPPIEPIEEDETGAEGEFVPTPYGFYILLSELRQICEEDYQSSVLTYVHYLRFGRFLVDCHGKRDLWPLTDRQTDLLHALPPEDESLLIRTYSILGEHGWDIMPEQWFAFLANRRQDMPWGL